MPSASQDRPNILFLLSDDQGPWALGCAGNDEIRTPELDRLAARGARMENFFCASPVCSPARASLLTGTIPSTHGVHDYIAGHEAGDDGVDYLAGQVTFCDVLAAEGYRLGLIGKWHLGASDRPRAAFEHWFALEGGSSDYRHATMFRGTSRETVTGYLTDILADDAIDFLERHPENRPFFLSVNFTAPHKPWTGQHPARFEQLYENCEFASCPQEEPHPWQAKFNGRPIAAEDDTQRALVGYFAAVTAMDEAIGRILTRLTDLGLERHTLIVFLSDNGFNCGHNGIWGKGNGTLPQNMYDTSVKVPALFSHPGRIPEGQVLSQLVSAYDVPATLLELAGLDAGELEAGPGQSFASLLLAARPEAQQRPVVVYDEYGPVRMIRSHDWKYVHRYAHGPHELYDLRTDPHERRNVVDIAENRDIVAGLRRQLHDWFTRYATRAHDGSALPVSGGGQAAPLGDDPLSAFVPRRVDAVRPVN